MSRSKAPCGTDAAYRRHLRGEEAVDDACREAHRRQIAAQRAAKRKPEVPPALVPRPVGPDGGAGIVDHIRELRWQAEQLREGIVWAVVNDPGKVAAMSRERRETMADLEQAQDAAGAATPNDAVGAMWAGPPRSR